MIDISPTCPVCGVPVRDPELHQRFHDGLREITRHVEAPDMTPGEYDQAIREQWEREGRTPSAVNDCTQVTSPPQGTRTATGAAGSRT